MLNDNQKFNYRIHFSLSFLQNWQRGLISR